MNARTLVFGVVGVAAGLIAGIVVDRKLASHPAPIAPNEATLESVEPKPQPKTTLQSLRPAEPPREPTFKTTGRVSIAELPLAIEKVLRESQSTRYMSMMELGNRIDDADIAEALGILAKHPSLEARNMVSQRLMIRWAALDPKAALAYAKALTPSQQRTSTLQSVIATWAERDPSAAAAYAEALPIGQERTQAFQSLISGIAANNPQEAWALANSLPDLGNKAQIYSTVLSQWAQKDPEGAAKAAMTLATGRDSYAFSTSLHNGRRKIQRPQSPG
jgi:hypothetical protein